MQVRAELERMVYNFALVGKIENDAATKIAAFIGITIGGDDEPRCRIIPFPSSVNIERPAAAEIPQPLDEEEDERLPYQEWYENFKDSGLGDYGRVSVKILRTLYRLGINSLEELAKTPLYKIKRRHYVGEQSLDIIRAVLERNGFTAKESAAL